MSAEKKPSPFPPEVKRSSSGEHPAVKSFRQKMESISDEEGGTAGAVLDLDKALESYLQECRSTPPPEAVPVSAPCLITGSLDQACVLGTKGCEVKHLVRVASEP